MGTPQIPGTRVPKSRIRYGGRIKGKFYEKDYKWRDPTKVLRVPGPLKEYQAKGLLDSMWKREPLPDVVRPVDLDYIWEAVELSDTGRRVKPRPSMDDLSEYGMTNYAGTKADQEE
jgi:hypothetical protein